MSTLLDVMNFITDARRRMELLGATGGMILDFEDRFKKVGNAICLEEGFERGSMRHVMNIPDDTELGREAEQLFTELKVWIRDQEVRT